MSFAEPLLPDSSHLCLLSAVSAFDEKHMSWSTFFCDELGMSRCFNSEKRCSTIAVEVGSVPAPTFRTLKSGIKSRPAVKPATSVSSSFVVAKFSQSLMKQPVENIFQLASTGFRLQEVNIELISAIGQIWLLKGSIGKVPDALEFLEDGS